jgi:transcriptional regulator with XRE-family HTH domain
LVASPTGVFDHAKARRAREKLKMTQAGLAEELGVHLDTVYDWENGRTRPSVTKLKRLAAALGMKTEDLYSAPAGRTLLIDLRVAAGKTQQDLADDLNRDRSPKQKKITRAIVSNWERLKTFVPDECVDAYAAALGVDILVLTQVVQETIRAAGRIPRRPSALDDRTGRFEGADGSHAELEFVSAMAEHAQRIVANLAVAGPLYPPDGPPEGQSSEYLHFKYRLCDLAHQMLRDVRERAGAVLDVAREKDREVAQRARMIIWVSDQYFSLTEDLLYLPREPLAPPFDKPEVIDEAFAVKLAADVFGEQLPGYEDETRERDQS